MAAHIVEISLLVICLFSAGNTSQCKRRNYALIGKNVSMDCNLEHFYEVYWYKDKMSSSTPLVKIVGGKKTVPTWEEGHYDITDKGALIIYNLKNEDYGKYTILCVYPDDTFVEDIVQLDTAIQPRQSCPGFSNCSSCQCVTAPNKIHNVTCIIKNARPLVNLSLLLETAVNHTVLFREEGITYDNSSDTWDSRAMIVVLIPNCDTAIRLRCTVIGGNDFSVSDSLLELTSDRCFVSATPTVSMEYSVLTFFEDHWLFAVMVALSLIVLCAFVFICLAIKRNRNVSQNTDGRNNLELESNNPLIEKQIEIEEALINLLGQLQCRYQGMTYIKPFTSGAHIPIHELYTGIKCHISDFTSTKCSITSTSVSNSTVIDNKRVLLIADIGQGKTALCKYMASQWLNKTQEEQKEDILFILPLNDIDITVGIERNLHKLLSLDITYEVLCDIVRTRKCHLLLDGLKNQSPGNTKYKDKKDLVQRLFSNAMWNQYPHLRLWVTSRYVDEQNCVCKEPYTKVKLSGFDDEQIDEYIVKTVSYYKRLSGTPTDSSMECLQNKVRSIFDQNNILTGFKTTVMLTVLFIHIITSQLLGVKGPFQEVNLNKLTPLVRSVIAHFNQTFADNSDGSLDTCKEKLTYVRVKLGKDLFDSNFAAPLEKTDISNEWIQICQSVGYIKHNTRRLKDNSSANVNQFYDYVQEFCVAEYILSDNVPWLDIVVKVQHINQAKFSRLLIILCDLSKTMKEEILMYLSEEQLWNQLADCLYEIENDDVIKDIENNNNVQITAFSNPLTRLKGMPYQRSIRARCLDTQYHQNALKVFFMNSIMSNINYYAISFGEDCPVDFLLKLTLPKVQSLMFRSFTIGGPDNFMKIVLWAIDKTQNVTKGIRFHECNVPNTVDCLRGVVNKIEITRTQNDGKEETLDLKTGTWK